MIENKGNLDKTLEENYLSDSSEKIEYILKTGELGEKVVNAYKKIENSFTDNMLDEAGRLKTGGIAEKVVSVYQKIEDSVVDGYKKIEDKFTETFLEKK